MYAESAAGRPGADHGPWGRERELATVGRLFDGGSLRAVLLEGEAGIGKSAVWAAGLAEAYRCGYTVLSATGSEAETGLSYTGLTDLFEKVADEVLPQLPDLQREPLEVALLRRAPAAVPTGQREVSVAALGALRLISERGPVLVAVDDLQWVDRVSVEALAFALRRPGTESVRLLAAARLPGGATAWSPTETEAELSGDQQDRTGLVLSALPSDAREVIRLEPLATSVIDRLLTERLGQQLPRNVLTALVERTAGNPFWSLEVGAALARDGVGEGALPVPESLSALVAGRLATLSTPVRDVLLVVSALSHPTTDLAYRALGMKPGDAGTAIDEAIAAGVVTESESRLRPEHPLLGSAALDSLLPGVRVALHRRLAEAVDDPEQHARHLVLAANNSGPELLAALDAGVRAAKSRGATSAAAELSELAVRYTPHTEAEGLQQRRMEAAELLFTLGQTRRAHDHLVAVYASYPTPLVRRRVLPLLVETTYWLHSPVAAADLVREAIDSSQQDPYLLATAYALGADVGDGRGTDRVTLAERALAMFDELGEEPDPRVLATALTYLALARLDAGDGISYDLLERAERAERQLPWVPITLRASYARQIWLKAVDEVDACVRAMRGAVTQAQLEGDEFALAVTYGHLALAECWAGRYALATEAADRGFECAGPGEARPAVLYGARGLLLVLTGDTASARALMTEELAVHGGGVTDVKAIVLRQVLGAAALVEGDVEEAVDVLSTALRMARAEGIYEPGRRQRLEGDLGQVLVATGRLAEATDLAAELRALGERAGRPAVLGVGLRIEGLVRAAEGDLGAAQDLLEQAVRAHEQSQLPLERGRSLLALGQVQRRLRSKVQAKQSLQAAFDCFTELGATPFVELAAAELDRIEPARGNTGLTRAEQRIVDLVAAGHSNREIAAELFVSVRTVETHLGSVYRKLSIRSRTELVRRFAGG